jgi:anti-anti-sigma factor
VECRTGRGGGDRRHGCVDRADGVRSARLPRRRPADAHRPTWLWIQDDLDLATVRAARAELAALFAGATAPRSVLLYLGVERFVDVGGLRLLVETARRARDRGGDLAVVAPPRCLQRIVARFDLHDELFLAADARHASRWVRR